MNYFFEIVLVIAVLFLFSVVSIRKRLLDFPGTAIANIFGLAIFFLGGLADFFVTVLFFVAAELGTRLGTKRKPFQHETRTIGNIFGNGGPAIIALLLNSQLAFFGAISAALADTLSSELGMLSKKKPVLITTLKTVETGTDGGITGLGLLSALLGALIIAFIYFALNGNLYFFFSLVIAGFFGSIVDSFCGAILERKKLVGNTTVNFIGSSAGALLVFALSKLL